MTLLNEKALQRKPQLLRLHSPNDTANRIELATGLLAETSSIAPKFLYDALGSRLFAAITELPEYYPTRTEAAIFSANRDAMAAEIGMGRTMVDLGAGNCEKAAGLFGALRPSRYVAVDISADYLADALDYLQFRHPELDLLGIGMDFSTKFSLPSEVATDDCVVFYPGSSIGNFTPNQAEDFLRQVRSATKGGGLLIGVDLVKPVGVLEPAYDDALGVTAAFNLNMLLAANHLLGANFGVADFRHVAYFNTIESRIEMHLEAIRDVSVCWSDASGLPNSTSMRAFKQGERIHTENSYKYTVENFISLLKRTGYRRIRHWTDAENWFAVFWAEA
jgi:L-histidine Nalpha-methyltransferase